jgi:hypothetical protein
MPKLAEALVERKGLQERLGRLQTRLAASAKVQEGDVPAEQPAELVEEARRILADIKRLTMQINLTNLQTVLPGSAEGGGTSLMAAIAERDRLRDERTLLEQLGAAARFEPTRGYGVTRNEIKWRATVDVADIQRQIDALSQSYRLLDTRIQEANWLSDLIQN